MIFRIIRHLHLLLGLFLLTGLCLAREPDGIVDEGAGWMVGVLIGGMVLLCIIIACCVCKKSDSNAVLFRPAEIVDLDINGLNKSVYHEDHIPNQIMGRGVHFDVPRWSSNWSK